MRRNARERDDAVLASLKRLAERAAEADTVATLLGLEGAAARLYFGAFPSMVRKDLALPGGPFGFEGRNRRPPLDPVNTLLWSVSAVFVPRLRCGMRAVGTSRRCEHRDRRWSALVGGVADPVGGFGISRCCGRW